MKLGEIKLESLRLMFANDEDLNINNINTIEDADGYFKSVGYRQDDRYKDYLDRMPGAINRAISRFMTYKVIPTKTVEVKPSQGETLKQFLKFNLKKILSDYGSLERIIYIDKEVVPNIDYQMLSDEEVLIPYRFENDDEVLFMVEYIPILDAITVNTDNNEEIKVPEVLARIIPYFVKADLFEQDEPELAATARNIFESALTEYVSFGITRKQRQQYVKNTMF